MADDVGTPDAEMLHQGAERYCLAGERQLTRQPTATGIPLAMIPNDAISLRENRLNTQRSEPVGAGAMVDQHDMFTSTAHFVFELDVRESCSVHRCHDRYSPSLADHSSLRTRRDRTPAVHRDTPDRPFHLCSRRRSRGAAG